MTTSRLNQLLLYYRDEPNDPFNIYALALEYLKSDTAKAREFFDLLLDAHENYIPTYYHAAKLYQESGDRKRAIQLYEKGIQLAKQHRDLKAARELQSAYEELIFE
jgi:tetratricopeptide (TPR) repeat protein